MTIVAREDLMAFLKAKSIRRIRIGEAAYYSLQNPERRGAKDSLPRAERKVCGKSLDGFTKQTQILVVRRHAGDQQ